MAQKMPRNLNSSTTGAGPKTKKLGIFSSTSKGDNLPATTQLMFPKIIQLQSPYSHTLHFKTEDKIFILFKHKNYCVVQRKYDRTVAVLKNAVFKQRNPPIRFDGTKMEAVISNNIRIVLMYTVAKTTFSDPTGIEFEKDDVIFTLAACGEKLLGIAQNYKVGFFPSDLVHAITKRRLCFFEGMMLEVTATANFEATSPKEFSVRRGQDYKISKGKKGLFDWYASNDQKVPLNFIAEKGTDVPVMTEDEEIYETISEGEQPLTPETPPLYDRYVSTFTSDWDDEYETPREKSKVNRSTTKQSTSGVTDSWKNPENTNEIEKVFQERLALESTRQASNEFPSPLPGHNSVYVDATWSPVESPRYTVPPTKFSELSMSAENSDTATIDSATVDEERTLYDRIAYSWGTSHAVSEQAEDKMKHKPNGKIQDLLNRLTSYRDVMMNDQLKCIVSEYVDEDIWDELGRRIKVSKNKRREIENKEDSIYAKTNKLLEIWCERFGSDATIGFLLDALVEVNPEDLELILEDVCKELSDNNAACGRH